MRNAAQQMGEGSIHRHCATLTAEV